MPARPWYDDLEDWAIRKGAPVRREGPPGYPMKPRTVKMAMIRLKRLMTFTEPPYLMVEGEVKNGNPLNYVVGMDLNGHRCNIRRIRPEQLAVAFDGMFPHGVTSDVAQNHSKYLQAAILLGRWLAYDLKEGRKFCWTEADLDRLRVMVPTKQFKAHKLSVIDPEKFDRFLSWLEKKSPETWATLWAMRFIGLRYSGMRGADRQLKEKYPKSTFRVRGGRWTIWEKWHPREFEVPDHVKMFIEHWKERMVELHPDSETFFVNTKGGQWNVDSSALSKMMRRWWIRWCDDTGEDLDDEDLERCHVHMCRHICATNLAIRNVQAPVIKEYMGHKDLRTTQLYIDLISSRQKEMIDTAFSDFKGW